MGLKQGQANEDKNEFSFFGWTIPLTESLWAWLVARLWDICCFMMAVLKPRQEAYGTLGLLDENSIWLESINYSPEISLRIKQQRAHTLYITVTYTLQLSLSLSFCLYRFIGRSYYVVLFEPFLQATPETFRYMLWSSSASSALLIKTLTRCSTGWKQMSRKVTCCS